MIKRREEARADYEEAKKQGRTAGLLEQERPNVFTQSLANLPAGAKIEVEIHVVQPLAPEKGRYELALPTVVAPRFVPGTPRALSTAEAADLATAARSVGRPRIVLITANASDELLEDAIRAVDPDAIQYTGSEPRSRIAGSIRPAWRTIHVSPGGSTDDAIAIISELESSPEVESITSVRMTKDANRKVKVNLSLEAWVLPSETAKGGGA